MHPVLFKIGNITLYSYGLFVALGFMAALWLANRRAQHHNIRPEFISDLFFVILASSLIGARFFYVILNLSEFSHDFLGVFKIWNGGLVFYGGFLFALVSALFFVRRQDIDLWTTADVLAPPIALGHALGRVGCLFAGCCYGRSCDLPWAIEFHNPDSLAPLNLSLHPTQIYSIISNLLIFLLLILMERIMERRRDQKAGQKSGQKAGFKAGKKKTGEKIRTKGMIFWTYILLYGLFRSIIEIFRGDFRGNFFMDILSVSQVIGIAMSIFAVFVLFFLLRRQQHDQQS